MSHDSDLGPRRIPQTDAGLPVAVIGAGPVGLAAAAHLLARGLTPLVFEAGPSAGTSIRGWQHVRMFSPWRYNVDRATRRLLEAEGWTMPDAEELPTGRDLMERYLPLVRYNAERVHAKLPDEVDVEDLMSAGIFGLMDAIDAFDMERGVKFETYCAPRIRGAILDELRSMDWVPRLVRSRTNQVETARKHIEMTTGRKATDDELAPPLISSVTFFIVTSWRTVRPGTLTSPARLPAKKPSPSQSWPSGLTLAIWSRAQWWLVIISPRALTNDAEHPRPNFRADSWAWRSQSAVGRKSYSSSK